MPCPWLSGLPSSMISKDEACQYLNRGLERLGLAPLPSQPLEQLWLYFLELAKWNSKMNLVAKAPELDILETHFLDSLTLLPEIGDGPLLDVGSGAGFPGLALKIARPGLAVTLLEPRQKRVSFLRQVIRALGLHGITVLDDRLAAGDLAFVQRHGQFPVITCRALTEIDPFLAMVQSIAPLRGLVVCMKGPRAEEELAAWQQQSPASPFVLARVMRLNLPYSGAGRNLIIFQKAADG